MNIKRILAAASASIVAVSAMAVTSMTSFAAETKEAKLRLPLSGSWEQIDIGPDTVEWYFGKDTDFSKVESIHITSVNTQYNPDGDALGCLTIQYSDKNGSNVKVGDGIDEGDIDASDINPDDFWIGIGTGWDGSGWCDGGALVTITLTMMDADAQPAEFKNDDTNIEISAPAGALPEGTAFSAAPVADSTNDTQFAFDLKFTKDDKEVQPTKAVTVKIPVPEKIKDAKDIFVFHVEDGKNVKVDCKVENGMVVFSASKFSTYIVTSENLNANKEEESKPEESKPTTSEVKLPPNHERPAPGTTHTGPNYERPVPSTTNDGNAGNSGNSGNSGTTTTPTDPGTTNPSNPTTGVAIAFAPALLAGAAVVVAKKRK